MKRFPLCALAAGAAALVTQLVAVDAMAQGVKDQLGTVTKKPDEEGRPAWMKKMAGSSVDLSSYIGSGSFYASNYHNPYVSMAVFVRPTYDLGTRFKLSANARLYVEEELTMPDVPNGRRFSPYDIWLWLSAKDLHTFAGPKIRLGGVARLVVPISYESRYAHMLTAVTFGPSLGGELIFGGNPNPDKRWRFSFMLLAQFTKYVHGQDFRGVAPGDTSNCRDFAPGAVSFGPDGAPAASDTCGGPINPSFGVRSAIVLGLARGKWTLGMTMLVDNTFLHYVAPDMYTDIHAVDRGREDTTWGIIGLTYSVNDHFAVNAGISSQQPALDSRVQGLRFPFFDSSGGNANNFTQAFLSLTGTL